MNAIANGFLQEAERVAAQGSSVEDVLTVLRQLSLDDFGLFIISLPNDAYPSLSRILPNMASEKIQNTWTGANGKELLRHTLSFVRIIENNYVKYNRKALEGATMLDFGCGYGRVLRLLYRFSNPDQIWGVDAWDKSLATCREAGILGNLAQSERTPQSLPVGEAKFDLAFALSIFTHLAPATAVACLDAIRKHMKPGGIFVPTIRPIEFWPYITTIQPTINLERMMADHVKDGIAYSPHGGSEGETYGDTSLTFDFFKRPGWEYLGYDRSIIDTFQVAVVLRAV